MGFEICGILVLWEKGGEEGRNRERRVGQEPWSIIACETSNAQWPQSVRAAGYEGSTPQVSCGSHLCFSRVLGSNS